MKQTNNLTLMVAQILLRHANKEQYMHHLNHKYRECFLMEEDISSEEKGKIDAMYKKTLCTRQISQNPYPIRVLPS